MTGLVNGETATFTTTGTQTEVGTSSNTYEIKWEGTAKSDDYSVSATIGTLTVTKQSIVPGPDSEKPDPDYLGITIDSPSDHVYDGAEHKWEPVVKDKEGNDLVEDRDYTVAYDKTDYTNVGTINVTITGVGNYKGEVTKPYKITPAPLTITTESASKVYDTEALTAGGNLTGLVNGETATFKTTGSQIEVGYSSNTYSLTWDGSAKESNYEIISETIGTLTVNDGTPTKPVDPDKVVTKSHDGKEYGLGDTVTFTITVTNIYDAPKTITIVEKEGVTITGQSVFENVPAGATRTTTATYKITERDILAGGFTNVVTAKFEGGKDFSNKDDVNVDPVKATYTVDKTIVNPQKEYKVGDKIQYQVKVANTGNLTISNVTITDQLQNAAGKVTFTDLDGAKLNNNNTVTIDKIEPNGEVVLKCEYRVVRADAGKSIVNTAIAKSDTEIPDPDNPEKPIKPADPKDQTDPASVEKMYTLTVHYVYANGRTAAQDYTGKYLAGESYGPVYSPDIDGYTPSYSFIRSGKNGMPARNVELTVVYTANPVPVTPGNGDGDGGTPPAAPAPTGAAVQADDNGNVNVTPVVDDKVPLARQNLDDHDCCILHFLLMLLALIALICYTADMKKRQERIAELKDELETEQIKRSGLGQ